MSAMPRLQRWKSKKEVSEELQKAALSDHKAKERGRKALRRLRSYSSQEFIELERKAVKVSAAIGLQKLVLDHHMEIQAERESRRASMDTKTLNDELRTSSTVEQLRAHIRKKMLALSYGCVDIKDFYRRLFASFDNDYNETLDVEEIGFLLRKYCSISADDVRTALALMDADDNGTIDFDEFFNFLDIKAANVSIKARDVPITPRSKIEWCLARVQNQQDLTFVIHLLKSLADKQPPLVFLKKGAVEILWNIVLEYTVQNAQADLVLEGEKEAITAARALGANVSLEDMQRRNALMRVYALKTEILGQCALPNEESTNQITLDQRDTAIEILEILSNSFAVLSSKLKDVPLPDPEQLVFELHVRSVHVAKHHVQGGTTHHEDDSSSDSETEEEGEGQTLEERLASMQAKVEATRLRVEREKEAKAAADGENKQEIIEQLIDVGEILFLMRCIFVQFDSLDQMRLLELLECVLLILGEGKHHEVLGLTRAHRRVAQSILAKFQPQQVDQLLKALKKSDNPDYVYRVIIRTGKKVWQGMKQRDTHAAKWDNRKKEEKKRLRELAFEKQRKIQTLEKLRRKISTEEASKVKKRKIKKEKERRIRETKKQLEEEQKRRKRFWDMKKRLKADFKQRKKLVRMQSRKELREKKRSDEERERKNQEALREWRREKARLAREKDAKRRDYTRRRRSRKSSHLRLPSVDSKSSPATEAPATAGRKAASATVREEALRVPTIGVVRAPTVGWDWWQRLASVTKFRDRPHSSTSPTKSPYSSDGGSKVTQNVTQSVTLAPIDPKSESVEEKEGSDALSVLLGF